MNTKSKHFWEELGEKDLGNYQITKITYGKSHCLCGTKIKNIITITNKQTNQQKIIGGDCAKRLGFKLKWTNINDYLYNSTLCANTQKEKQFTISLQDKLPKWDKKLKLTQKQKQWLEAITKHQWKWGVWK